jgi:tetratricopeptide (TPR) repeat protein
MNMRLLTQIITILLVISLAPAVTLAIDRNTTQSMAQDENISFIDQSTSRFYSERSSFETNLIQRIPAPQEYIDELPPAGAKEVIYDSGDLKLKAWLSDKPADDNKHPAVVFAHGGFSFGGTGWNDGQEFINHGFVLMTPMLRGENGNPGNFEYFYGEVNDLLAAADYLANVSYVDSEKIFLCGHSVGGTLSILSSMMPSNYRAISSFGGMPDTGYLIKYGGYPIPYDSKNIKEFELRSAIYHSDSIIKPLFIYVGDQEDASLIQFSKDFVKYEKWIGKPCEFTEVKGDHWSSVAESVRLSRIEFEDIQAYEALALNRSLSYSWITKGNDLLNLTRYDDALKCFDRAIAADAFSALAWNAKGSALGEMGRYDEAIKCFEKAIEIDDEFSLAWENKSLALRALGKIAESNSALVKAKQLGKRW